MQILLFFAGFYALWVQRKRSKRKAALKPGLWLSSILQLPEAVTRTRFAQTACDLHPQLIASLGCVLMGRQTKIFLEPNKI